LLIHRAQAQASVYGGINATQYGFSSSATDEGNYQPGSGYSTFYSTSFGLEAGGTYLFPSSSRLKGGIDLREIYSVGNSGGNAGFAALRIAFVPHHNPVSPYFELGGGYIHVPLPGEYVIADGNGNIIQVVQQNSVTGGAAEFLLGVEVRAGKNWSVRALELGGYAGSNVALSSIGAGVIYHFHATKPQKP
jgi:hypothetical protein